MDTSEVGELSFKCHDVLRYINFFCVPSAFSYFGIEFFRSRRSRVIIGEFCAVICMFVHVNGNTNIFLVFIASIIKLVGFVCVSVSVSRLQFLSVSGVSFGTFLIVSTFRSGYTLWVYRRISKTRK